MTVLDILVALIIIYIIVHCKKQKKNFALWVIHAENVFTYLIRITLSLLCFIHILNRINWEFVFQILDYKIL